MPTMNKSLRERILTRISSNKKDTEDFFERKDSGSYSSFKMTPKGLAENS